MSASSAPRTASADYPPAVPVSGFVQKPERRCRVLQQRPTCIAIAMWFSFSPPRSISRLRLCNGGSFRFDHQDRSVRGSQILLRSFLQQLRRNLPEFLLKLVDPRRIVVKEREARQQV